MLTSTAGINLISKRIRNYRTCYPLTQKQLAEKSGVSLRSIQRFEKGEDIQLGNLIKLMSAMELDSNLDMLIPDVTKRPSAFVEKTKIRQRVRIKEQGIEKNKQFKWGDEK